MEFKLRAVDDRSPPYMPPPPPSVTYPIWHSGIPIDTSEAIYLREMEKQRFREDVIAEEITRRRVLEAEVRRELMVDREMAMRRAAEMGLPYEERFKDQRGYTSRCGLGCSHDQLPQPEVAL